MKTILSLFIAIVIAGSAAAQDKSSKTAVQFNDQMVSIVDSLYKMGRQWGMLLTSAYKSRDFKSLTPQRQKMEAYLKSRLEEIRSMNDVGEGGKELRLSMISFLEFELALFKSAFVIFEELPADATKEAITKALEQLKTESAKESGEIAKLQVIQARYAEKNGFAVQGN